MKMIEFLMSGILVLTDCLIMRQNQDLGFGIGVIFMVLAMMSTWVLVRAAQELH